MHWILCSGTVGENRYTLGTVFILNSLQFSSAFVQGFLPGDSFPFRIASFTDIFQGVLQPIRIIEEFDAGIASGANGTTIINRFRIAFDLYKAIIPLFPNELTAPETHFTNTPDNCFFLERAFGLMGGTFNTAL